MSTERFTLISELGRGGMGSVWKARDEETGQIVALKLLHSTFAGDPEYLERFERELELAKRIHSPHVVGVLGYGVRDGSPYLALEYVDGPTLHDALQTHGPYTWEETRALLAQIAQGLADAHAAGVIHRDIKPSNILIAPDGTAKLSDFGIAKGLDLTRMTATSTILGTPAYLAPEGTKDERSDLYSLGVIGYELLTGAPPFAGTSYQDVIVEHIRTPPDLSKLPEEARPTIGWLLAKNPADRPQRASALLPVLFGAAPKPIPALADPDSAVEAANATLVQKPSGVVPTPPVVAAAQAVAAPPGVVAAATPSPTPPPLDATLVAPRAGSASTPPPSPGGWQPDVHAAPTGRSGPAAAPSGSQTPLLVALGGVALAVCVLGAVLMSGVLARSAPSATPIYVTPSEVAVASPSPSAVASASANASASPGSSATAAPTPTAHLGTWQAADPLPDGALWASAAVVLQDGRVFLMGGADGPDSSDSVAHTYLLDPTSGHWTRGPDMAQARTYPMAVLLQDGTVLVAGGSDNNVPLSSAERYYPSTNSWTTVSPMSVPRTLGTLTVFPNTGHVLAAGGGNEGDPNWGATATTEIFDPDTNDWTMGPVMVPRRVMQSAAVTNDGRILIVGGATTYQGSAGSVAASPEVISDGATSTLAGPAMPQPLFAAGAVWLTTNQMLVGGGWHSEADNDPSHSDCWLVRASGPVKTAAPLNVARAQYQLLALPDGRALAVQGIDPSGQPTRSMEIYDPSKDIWQRVADAPQAAFFSSSVVLKDGRVAVIGGALDANANSATDATVIFTPPAK